MLRQKIEKNVIMACHITGVFDVNRKNILKHDDFSLVQDWVNSISDLNLQGIIFHNNFSEATLLKHQNKKIIFLKIDYEYQFNPNVYRYFIYRDFLLDHPEIENIFVTDVSDAVAIQNPFEQNLFLENTGENYNENSKENSEQNSGKIFCGDEPKQLDNDWMIEHSTHLRNKIPNYSNYEKIFAEETLLNCGIIGGHRIVMLEFLKKLCALHKNYNYDNQTAFTGDMGAFNYLVRTKFNTRLIHGEPVNTIFKAYQTDRNDCWFRHK